MILTFQQGWCSSKLVFK